MLDLKAIAAAHGFDIPHDQLERIAPVLEKLQNEFRAVLQRAPDGSSSAIQFQADEDVR
jgi:hypothetical protein